MKALSTVEIKLDHIKTGLKIWIEERKPNSLFDAKEDAEENNEARFQLLEGCFYDYELNLAEFQLGEIGFNIIKQHKRKSNLGTLATNIYVGSLEIPVVHKSTGEKKNSIFLEVRSVKSNYRDDYRDMLAFITEKCTDLLLQANSPTSQYFDIDHTKDNETLYQKFAFVKSVISNDEFSEAVHRILVTPVTKWNEVSELKDIRRVKRLSNVNIKALLQNGNRSVLPKSHYLRNYGIASLPRLIDYVQKTDSIDTHENQFIKHALETFLKFCIEIHEIAKKETRLKEESSTLIEELENQLNHSFFKEISKPTTLNLNSPVLQRKEGYREILKTWLMFDLAAKLTWQGGEDVYRAGQKNIANLYEYWLFFKLLSLFQELFNIPAKELSDLIKKTNKGLNLDLKQGHHTALEGTYTSSSRKLKIRFNYNKEFKGKNDYPAAGSWTTTLRPDYTLTIWPESFEEKDAEEQELIVHIHFDAKYKVANFSELLEREDYDHGTEKQKNREGVYKNGDLLKMHAYKDAIRRTGGAYILYPGGKQITRKGFHEILPGLGAFAVRPSKHDDGTGELKDFVLKVIEHFNNRATHRENIASKTYQITKGGKSDSLQEPIPEYLNGEKLIPRETFVLVGYCNEQAKHDWYKKTGYYNFRMNDDRGSLELTKEVVQAQYLLLRRKRKEQADELYEITSEGPKVFTRSKLIDMGYPNKGSKQDAYLVIKFKEIDLSKFGNSSWNFKNLQGFKDLEKLVSNQYHLAGIPFTTTIEELMRNRSK